MAAVTVTMRGRVFAFFEVLQNAEIYHRQELSAATHQAQHRFRPLSSVSSSSF